MGEMLPNGLMITRKFLDHDACRDLLAAVDAGAWSSELKRRVQHYGYRYDYKSRRATLGDAPPLPVWARQLVERLIAAGASSQYFDQLIVNEYLPGQGIAPHIDRLLFGNEIASVSLGAACIMTFDKLDSDQEFSLLLEEGDMLLLRAEARYKWRHGIKSRKTDSWQGEINRRARRVSLTFRKVLLP